MTRHKRITASTIKSWFQYRCERKIAYSIQRDLVTSFLTLPVAAAPWAELGQKFENAVVERLASENPGQVLRPFQSEVLEEKLSLAFVARQRREIYATQLQLRETPVARQLFDLESDVVIGASRPDLIFVEDRDDGPAYHLIDIKATQAATVFHKAQVAFYAILFRALLEQQRLPGTVAPEGQIWHMVPGSLGTNAEWTIQKFPLRSYETLVIDFFLRDLKTILKSKLSSTTDDTRFHIYFKCEGCEYLPHCQQSISLNRLASTRDVSAVAGLSQDSKQSLHRLGISTVGQLAAAKGLKAAAKACNWSLASRAELFVARAEALCSGRVTRLQDRLSFLMPPKADVRLYLVADVDAVSGNLATLGYLREQGTDRQFVVQVLASGTLAEEADAIRIVLGKLIADLDAIHCHNGCAERLPIYSHIFVYEPSEAQSLQAALGRHVGDEVIRSRLLHLIRMFPPEPILPDPDYRGVHHLPATAVRSVVEQLYALPITVSHDLGQVTDTLSRASTQLVIPYHPDSKFYRPFSARLSVDVCRALRDSQIDPGLVRADVVQRLESLASLVQWIFDDNATSPVPFLRLKKAPFRFQASFDPLNAGSLDVIRAHEAIENRAGLLSRLTELALPVSQRRDRLRCFSNLRLLKHGKSHVRARWLLFRVPPESRNCELSAHSRPLILHNDDPDIRLNPASWRNHGISIVDNNDEKPKENTLFVTMSAASFESSAFQRMLRENKEDNYHVDEAFEDVNFGRVDTFLRFLAQGGTSK